MIVTVTRLSGQARGVTAVGVLLVIGLLLGCTPRESATDPAPEGRTPSLLDQRDADSLDPHVVQGDTSQSASAALIRQTLYVPVYSHIFFQDEVREIDLAATLSVRNTDPQHPITVTSVRYYDSAGRLVRQYGEGAAVLPPLSSRAHVVGERDRTGGVGANFMVDWEASVQVSAPIVEAVMISTAGSQGISFVSRGQVVRPLTATGADRP